MGSPLRLEPPSRSVSPRSRAERPAPSEPTPLAPIDISETAPLPPRPGLVDAPARPPAPGLQAPGTAGPAAPVTPGSPGVVRSGAAASTSAAAPLSTELEQAITGLEAAIAQKDHAAAIPAATLLVQALDGDPQALTDDQRDRLCNAVRAAWRAAEEEDSWAWWEILLGILALGIPFLVDALQDTEVEQLESLCGDAVMRERRRIVDGMDIQAVDGADQGDLDSVKEALMMMPEPVLRDIQGTHFRVSGQEDPSGRGLFGVYTGADRTATIFAKPWYYFGLHRQPTTIHEAMHAWEHQTGRRLSQTPEFEAARQEDYDDLRRYERESGPGETFADTAVHYYYDIPWIVRLFMGDRPHLIDYYRNNVAAR